MKSDAFDTLTGHLDRAAIELSFVLLEVSMKSATQPSDLDRELTGLVVQCKRLIERARNIAPAEMIKMSETIV